MPIERSLIQNPESLLQKEVLAGHYFNPAFTDDLLNIKA